MRAGGPASEAPNSRWERGLSGIEQFPERLLPTSELNVVRLDAVDMDARHLLAFLSLKKHDAHLAGP
jgi:hypothetical protein